MAAAPKQTRPFLIAGGGIGGLAAALALAGRGYRCRVLEKRTAFAETGAGIQIGPNGVKALRALGVDQALEPKVGKPDEILVFDARRGRPLAALPLGETIAARLGAPYWTAHRADLHATLLDAAGRHPLIAITTGFAAGRLEATPDGVRLISTAGGAASGAALIGADGLWSTVRGYVADRTHPRFAGRRAYRAVVPSVEAPAQFQANATGLWLAPGAHVVHYPVRAGSEIAIVVILAGAASGEGAGSGEDWAAAADRAALLAGVRHLAPELTGFLAVATEWKSWGLFETAPLERWTNSRVALLGDAAHPVLPFLAQGGALALEDALTLAAEVDRSEADIPAAFAVYAAARMKRTRRVAAASRRNGQIYHLAGAAAMTRNLVLRATPAPRLIAQYDWLYGWTPPAQT